jgi:4,5-DOPA dioxygenase extradiol
MGSGRMPAIHLSHGASPLADDPSWAAELAADLTQFG